MSAMQLPDVTAEQFLRAVRDGVSDAMWQMMTNATDMPCHDFYEMVKSRHQGSRLHGEASPCSTDWWRAGPSSTAI